MNSVRRRIVVIAAVVLVAMLFFPPYHATSKFTLNALSDGYGFIGTQRFSGYINWALLILQWCAVIFLAAIFYAVSADKE
jgi:hypothetical protein